MAPKQPLYRSAAGALPYDPKAAVTALSAADSKLAALIERVGQMRMKIAPSFTPYRALATSIAHQQLTGKAAQTILGRLEARFGGRFPKPDELLALPEGALREVGFSGAKSAALRDLAGRALDGTVPPVARLRRMSDDDIVEHLTAVRGVGRWTVEMLLIFRLGRPDVLPVDDYGVRKGFTRTYRKRALVTPAQLRSYGERWRPYRSVASWYFWRALELP